MFPNLKGEQDSSIGTPSYMNSINSNYVSIQYLPLSSQEILLELIIKIFIPRLEATAQKNSQLPLWLGLKAN